MAIGSHIRQFLILFTLFCVFYLVFFPASPPQYVLNYDKSGDNALSNSRFERLPVTTNTAFLAAVKEWRTCFEDSLKTVRKDPEGMWYWIRIATNACRNKTTLARLELSGIKNKDEMKYHIYDKTGKPAVVVTMGIGLDVKAEKTLQDTLPKGSRFYGADPIFRGNADLFDPLGPFFPFAVGKEIEVSSATVLHEGKYKNMTMPHIDIITFITKYVNEKFIDQLLMDNEGPEYDILPMMARGKEFDQNGIVVCQVNTEVHNANKELKEEFLNIMNTIIDDGRYAFLVSYATVHHRFFFINLEHPYCVDRFYARFFE